MKISRLILVFCFFESVLLLVGCNRAERERQQPARQAFREALAGVKVACDGATFQEFRQRQLALDTAFEASKADLPIPVESYQSLHGQMWATEQCWKFYIESKDCPLPGTGNAPGNPNAWDEDKGERELWLAMQIITPSVKEKVNFTFDQRMRDRDFNAHNYVLRGLKGVQSHSDGMLQALRKADAK